MLNHLLYQAFKREKMTRKNKAAKNRPNNWSESTNSSHNCHIIWIELTTKHHESGKIYELPDIPMGLQKKTAQSPFVCPFQPNQNKHDNNECSHNLVSGAHKVSVCYLHHEWQ
jgi:hypothetical protein